MILLLSSNHIDVIHMHSLIKIKIESQTLQHFTSQRFEAKRNNVRTMTIKGVYLASKIKNKELYYVYIYIYYKIFNSQEILQKIFILLTNQHYVICKNKNEKNHAESLACKQCESFHHIIQICSVKQCKNCVYILLTCK